MTLRLKLITISILALGIFLLACKDQESPKVEIESSKYELVWADEFNYAGLPDPTKWGYDVGDACDLPCGCGWGNQELQYYTKDRLENARVEDGHLTIELRKEKMETRDYSSARLVTKNKGDWKYGRFEFRARIDRSLGSWAAIWMLPTDNEYGGWPNSGEIDIMEYVGWNQDSILATAHTGAYNHIMGTHKGSSLGITDAHKTFHNYVLEWTEDSYEVFIDDDLVFSFKNEGTGHMAWPFDKDFHLIFNIAFGGNLGGRKGIDPNFQSSKMEIDYVRVFQKKTREIGMKR